MKSFLLSIRLFFSGKEGRLLKALPGNLFRRIYKPLLCINAPTNFRLRSLGLKARLNIEVSIRDQPFSSSVERRRARSCLSINIAYNQMKKKIKPPNGQDITFFSPFLTNLFSPLLLFFLFDFR